LRLAGLPKTPPVPAIDPKDTRFAWKFAKNTVGPQYDSHYLLKFCFISTKIIALFGIENHFFPVYILFLEEEHKKWINSSTLNRWS
jgi:hypothetical protein